MNRRIKKKREKMIWKENMSKMELGNLLFGHSRGNFVVDRVLQDSSEWDKLIHLSDSDFYGYTTNKNKENDVGGYENEVFAIRPYWWGDDDALQAQMPNFLYKPTGFEIRWYKYPFRDSYMNKNLSVAKIKEIFIHCADSMK